MAPVVVGYLVSFVLLWQTLDAGMAVGVAYGVLGAFFMPFLSVTLLWLLNTDRVPREWRNKLPSNIALVLCTLAFGALALNEIRKAIGSL